MTTSNNDNFELVIRPHGECWKHKTENYWIVFYESLKKQGEPCFRSYRSIEYCENGRDPWTVNNKTVGKFYTLEDAFNGVNAKEPIGVLKHTLL